MPQHEAHGPHEYRIHQNVLFCVSLFAPIATERFSKFIHI